MLCFVVHRLGGSRKSAREVGASRLFCFNAGFSGSPNGLSFRRAVAAQFLCISRLLYSWFMLKNRSVPADVVLPHITYQNVAEALVWLTKAFGFIEHYRYGEPGAQVDGAQMHLGDAWIMLNSARSGCASPAQVGHQTQSLT